MYSTIILILALIVAGSFAAEPRLSAYSPPELISAFKEKGNNIHFNFANFGTNPYGKNLIGIAHYAEPRDACSSLKPINFTRDFEFEFMSSPIVVVDRGNCTFVTKAINAQAIGAKIVLIIYDQPDNVEGYIMADDGRGSDLTIPTIMINSIDGGLIRQFLNSDDPKLSQNVAFSVTFPMPKQLEKVQLEFWMSSADQTSLKFLQEFKKLREEFGNMLQFKPHYVLWFCYACQSEGWKDDNNTGCVSGGRYCGPLLSMNDLTGRDIVFEDLRQMCIYNISENLWWKYNEKYYDTCTENGDTDCYSKVLDAVGINKAAVAKCIGDSFAGGNPNLDDNPVLAEERRIFHLSGISFWPALLINNITFKGNLLPLAEAKETICEGLRAVPELCKPDPLVPVINTRPIIPDPTNPAKQDPATQNPSSGHTSSTIFLVVFVMLIFMFVVFLFYRRYVKKEMAAQMQTQINVAVSQYFAIAEKAESKKNVAP